MSTVRRLDGHSLCVFVSTKTPTGYFKLFPSTIYCDNSWIRTNARISPISFADCCLRPLDHIVVYPQFFQNKPVSFSPIIILGLELKPVL